jgi:CRISPR system Cascade subunit CasB
MNDSEEVKRFVASKLKALQGDVETRGEPNEALREDEAPGEPNNAQRAALARLRRGVGKEAGTLPEIWQYVYEGFPDALTRHADRMLHAENAIHAALTLYAMHAQGKGAVHDQNAGSLGKAANNLKKKRPENEQGIKRRFDALATAKTPEEINIHARGIIQLLRQGDVKLDYAGFAKDLYRLQRGSDSAKEVLRGWGKDFWYIDNAEGNKSKGDDNA